MDLPGRQEPPLLRLEQLAELDEHLRAQRVPVVERLGPGLGRQEMAAVVGPLGLELPEEAVVWWGWHDGAAHHEGDFSTMRLLGPFGEFQPLQAAVEHCRMRREIAHEVAPDQVDLVFAATLFPLLDFGDIAVDCAGPPSAPAPVWQTNPHTVDAPVVVSRSMGELVGWWLEGLRTKAYVWLPQEQNWLIDEQFRDGHPGRQGLP